MADHFMDMDIDPEFFLDEYPTDFDIDADVADYPDNDNLDVDHDDIFNLSWAELALSLGFAEEMLGDRQPKRISIAEYKQQESSHNKKGKRPDSRSFERGVDEYIKTLSSLETGGNDPVVVLNEKLELCGLTYSELQTSLLTTEKAKKAEFLPEDPELLNLNVCLDLINLANECIFLGSTDPASVLVDHVQQINSPQVRLIKQWLT